jgi:hypothetical protein
MVSTAMDGIRPIVALRQEMPRAFDGAALRSFALDLDEHAAACRTNEFG